MVTRARPRGDGIPRTADGRPDLQGLWTNKTQTLQRPVGEGFLAKDGSNTTNGRNVTLADGSQLFLGSSGAGAPPR